MAKRKPPIDTIPLFDEPGRIERPEPKRSHLAHHKPHWTKYRPKNPVKCDHCMQIHVETHGGGPLAAQARFARIADGAKTLLCSPHAQQQRRRDGMPELKGGPR